MAESRRDWNSFCGHEENFTAWENRDFGPCFEQLVIVVPTHIMLLIVSTYHLAQSRKPNLGNYIYKFPRSVKIRLLCVLMLMVLPATGLIISWQVLHISPSIVDILMVSIQGVCWLVHSVYVYRLKYLFWVNYRGPTTNIVFYLLTFVSTCIQLYSAIFTWIKGSSLQNKSEEICVYISFACHVIYLLTLIPNRRHGLGVEFLSQSLNASLDSPTEDEPLTAGRGRVYGSISKAVEPVVGEDGASWLSKLSFYWAQPLMIKGYKQLIETAEDLYLLPKRLDTRDIENKFSKIINKKDKDSGEYNDKERNALQDPHYEQYDTIIPRVEVESGHTKQKSLLRALHSAFGLEYYLLGILKLLADLAGFAGPILLNFLVSYIENKKEPELNGYYYSVGLLLSTLFGSICSTQFDYNIQIVGYKMRCAVIATVYKKALSVSSVSVTKFTSGEIVNFMSTDTDRILNFCPSFHAFWSLPFQVGVSLYLLHQQVGLAFLAGLGFAVILIPVNRWLAVKIGQLSTDMMHQKDARVKMMNELLYGMRVVKFYAWEALFQSKIEALREAELRSLKGRKYLDAMCVYFWATTPVLISILTFTTYSLLGHQLTAAKVFTSLSLFLMLISPLNAFPWVLNGLMEAWVSLRRLQSFVALSDFDMDKYYSDDFDMYNTEELVAIKSATFSWKEIPDDDVEIEPTPLLPEKGYKGTLLLQNISLQIEQGQFIGVIGKVGSGKSSLLNAILAEMCRVKGQIVVRNLQDGFALASQEPWIQHATIRDNILFGQPYKSRKYEAVIDAAALRDDLKIFRAGDQTEVGENGVTLSGGQKARVALARSLYQDKEVYLLDDPLAAVDAHVAQHLYERCIMGLLKNKTRILCTHHSKYLNAADLIVVMNDGKISQIGSPSEILDFIDLGFQNDSNTEDVEAVSNPYSEDGPNIIDQDDRLVEEEEKETGVVKLQVYKSYWNAVGTCLAPMVLTALFLMQASRNINDWWLSYWVSHSHHNSSSNNTSHSTLSLVPHQTLTRYIQLPMDYIDHNAPARNLMESEDNVKFYLTVYGCLAGANSFFTLLRAFLFAYGGICAAKAIHKRLLNSILKAPISFFDTTPIGRIINRFSSDLYSVDDSLPFILNIFLAQLFGIIGTIVVTCCGLPWFSLLLVPLGLIYYKIQQYYRHTSREIKRITSITLSPIYAHFSETVSGLVTIRAFRQSDRFKGENLKRLDLNQRAQFAGRAVASWLGFRLQMMGVIMVAGIAFIAVLEHHFHDVNPGLVGLALSYALSVTNLLSGVVNSFTETEKQMVSVERVQQYISDIPYEQIKGTLFVSPMWPSQGIIKFTNAKLRYRRGLPNALDGVTFITQPAEKIGIVGRTGSGKSSLFLALFRMVEIYNGHITIDGTDIQHLDLKDVRSNLAIIPQDPFLFSGSVKENLDPTNSYNTNDLWLVLERCHLKIAVERLGGIHSDVAERGRHFSVGQRQLLCLARALLTKAKILCIDEATASVDMETDLLLQETIRKEFVDSTVLTIAHRINTILDSDRVLVMQEGKVAEFDVPGHLLQNHNSLFYKLVNRSS